MAEATDSLGWDSFVEGRMTREGKALVKSIANSVGLYVQSEAWGAELVDRLV